MGSASGRAGGRRGYVVVDYVVKVFCIFLFMDEFSSVFIVSDLFCLSSGFSEQDVVED